jgi:4-diphosphocytidyl-2-C-methyl-D-erythritol kinase
MPTQVRSHSKINLGLAIGPPRPDGYHGLTTLYQTLELHDLVTVEAHPTSGPTQITLTSSSPFVPPNPKNTAWRAVELALSAMQISATVRIHIEKRLPVRGGLGGGSANAVAALVGLERELRGTGGAGLSAADRLVIAAKIGSDVPLFLIGGTVLGLGRGEEVYPMPDLHATDCVIAAPEIGVSTPQAFRDWDFRHGSLPAGLMPDPYPDRRPAIDSLTEHPSLVRLERLSRTLASALSEPHSSGDFSLGEVLAENPLLALVRTGIENDFEEVVFPQYPLLGEIKRTLVGIPSHRPEQAAIYAALSGSGSALFGLYGSSEAAEAACQRLGEKGVATFHTKTLPRKEYWGTMVQ